jgi:hypothetical protein
VRTSHDNIFVMFETKNTDDLDTAAVSQTATYLGDRVGRLGIIVTRQLPSEAMHDSDTCRSPPSAASGTPLQERVSDRVDAETLSRFPNISSVALPG